MPDDYTPTTEEVRNHYAYGCGPEHTWAETREDFDRWLGAHDAEKRAEWEAEQGEVEWEYGWSWADQPDEVNPYHPECSETERRELTANRSRRIAPVTNYRRKAGPWVPVNENGETP